MISLKEFNNIFFLNCAMVSTQLHIFAYAQVDMQVVRATVCTENYVYFTGARSSSGKHGSDHTPEGLRLGVRTVTKPRGRGIKDPM